MFFLNTNNRIRSFKNRGFTLVELLTVIAVMAILSAVAVTSFSGAKIKARHAKRISDLKQIESALILYSLSNNYQYPVTNNHGWYGLHSCWGLATADWIPGLVAGGYISVLPNDPNDSLNNIGVCNSNAQEYLYASNGTDFKLIDRIPEDCAGLAKLAPKMLDPSRDFGTNPSVVEGTNCQAIGIWTPGAITW